MLLISEPLFFQCSIMPHFPRDNSITDCSRSDSVFLMSLAQVILLFMYFRTFGIIYLIIHFFKTLFFTLLRVNSLNTGLLFFLLNMPFVFSAQTNEHNKNTPRKASLNVRPPKSFLFIKARVRNGQFCNTYQLLSRLLILE